VLDGILLLATPLRPITLGSYAHSSGRNGWSGSYLKELPVLVASLSRLIYRERAGAGRGDLAEVGKVVGEAVGCPLEVRVRKRLDKHS